jgi:2OG-Fe(II) oxygenase superfamily
MMNFSTEVHAKGIVEMVFDSDESHKKTKSYIANEIPWNDSVVGGGLIKETRNSSVHYIDKSTKNSEDVDSEIFSLVSKCIEEYTKRYDVIVNNDEGYQILRYGEGHYYKKHIDQAANNRRVSFLLYLNDDYEGGELNFPELNVCIKPKANSVVMFPSDFNYVHESLTVKSGTKYAVVTWLGYK